MVLSFTGRGEKKYAYATSRFKIEGNNESVAERHFARPVLHLRDGHQDGESIKSR